MPFYHELDMVTPEDLVKGNCGLSELLSLSPAHQMVHTPCKEAGDRDEFTAHSSL